MRQFTKLTLIAVGLLCVSLKAVGHAFDQSSTIRGAYAANYSQVALSSGQVFTGAGVVYTIVNSSGSSAIQADYCVAFDTVAMVGITYSTSAFPDSQRITPALVFSTGIYNNSNNGNQQTVWSPIPGTYKGFRVSNGLFIFKTTSASGEANRTFIYWEQ